ncbi:DNA-directed RNA polymerases I, II, and III subunit RPABC3 [Thelohanellus kitauei]|uniref:DNA-directed RNA polymerases I, II, and III subunit RPABC3 n=1 Tax=Thelohanellus kitauei TaxID=669202 RepID=A0A0C2MG64_THEKT|nr:DNA-directed RNA polymerases I, II, and III subunit RPABC3 [Thelohanellus kitauei]
MAGVLFEDLFIIKVIDPDGKKFEKVSRIHCHSESLRVNLVLDVATHYYSMFSGEKFRLVLASTLNEDGKPASNYYNRLEKLPSYTDHFDYVAHGKVYRVDGKNNENSELLLVYASFGGLLMRLSGHSSALDSIEKGQDIYLLIKKIAF